MKKKMKIPIHTTKTEPEGYTPFSMIFGSTWDAYGAGELSPEKILLMNVLYRRMNPYNGYGQTSYADICVMLKRKPTDLEINKLTKLVADLRDEHQLIWFPHHKGIREFPYVIADFKLAKIPPNNEEKWIDIKPYFQKSEQNGSRGKERDSPQLPPEPMPRQPPPEQRLERSNGGGIKSVGEIIRERESRPSQTDTNTQT